MARPASPAEMVSLLMSPRGAVSGLPRQFAEIREKALRSKSEEEQEEEEAEHDEEELLPTFGGLRSRFARFLIRTFDGNLNAAFTAIADTSSIQDRHARTGPEMMAQLHQMGSRVGGGFGKACPQKVNM